MLLYCGAIVFAMLEEKEYLEPHGNESQGLQEKELGKTSFKRFGNPTSGNRSRSNHTNMATKQRDTLLEFWSLVANKYHVNVTAKQRADVTRRLQIILSEKEILGDVESENAGSGRPK